MSKYSRASYSESVPSSPSQEQNGGRCNFLILISAKHCYFCQINKFKECQIVSKKKFIDYNFKIKNGCV